MMSTEESTPKRSFLVVDDDPFARLELADVVRDLGYEPWEAANTSEALSILDRSAAAFCGLITDVQMPGTRNGLVLANHVCTLWPHMKVIVVSGGRKPIRGELPEGAEFLTKPVPASRLVAAVGLAA